MRVMLGMLARSDRSQEPYLDETLSIVSPCFDGIFILDDEGCRIDDYSAQRNRLIEVGEREHYDWMFMLDSDECMFPSDIEVLKTRMTPENRLLVLPRYEFVKDLDHYDPQGYPDYQGRVFRLGIGYQFRKTVHEGLYRRYFPVSEMRLQRGVRCDDTPIYHYGRVKSTAEMLLKLHNYNLIAKGQPPVTELPEGTDISNGEWLWGAITRFEAPHPLRDQDPGSR
ncbi:MAG: hypothetical protein RBS17_03445 [Coriobacteriia bacterium]|nr:hypothetical protein [Coriobacteriia bacterium]